MIWKTKHDQVLVTLRGLLQAGEWKHVLPGYRTLERVLNVSRPTVERVLADLTAEGLLAEAEPGKGRRILAGPLPVTANAGNNLLILGALPVAELSWTVQHLLDGIFTGAREDGWQVSYDDFELPHPGNWSGDLERLVKDHHPDRVILISPTKEVANWFRTSGIPFFCCGGVVLSMINEIDGSGTSTKEMAEVAVRHLVRQGHSRILYPLAPMHRHLKTVIVEAAGSWGLGLKRIEIRRLMPVRRSLHPEGIQSDWRKWLSELKPTAVIVQHHRELLSLIGFCSMAGIGIPDELSVVSLAWEPVLKWMNPEVTAMEHPEDECAKRAIHWLRLPRGERLGWNWLEGRLLPGATVGLPRPEADTFP